MFNSTADKEIIKMKEMDYETWWDPEDIICRLLRSFQLFSNFSGDYQLGANAAGFKKVADAMIEQGQVFTNKL